MELLKTVTTAAPGKIILCGEHAVVYGTEAIASALDLKTRCCIDVLEEEKIFRLSFSELDIDVSWPIENMYKLKMDGSILLEKLAELVNLFNVEFQKFAIHVVLHLYLTIAADIFKTRNTGLHIKVMSEIPIGGGLGSSASLSVAVTSCLLVVCGVISKEQSSWTEEDLKEINYYAYDGEKIIHGYPSGIDNTVSTFGHFLSFKSGKIQCLPDLNSLELNLLVVNTKVSRSTKTLVEGVRKRREVFPDLYSSIFQAIGNVTGYFKTLLLNVSSSQDDKDLVEVYGKMENLVDTNQCLLDSIGVSHPDIMKIVNVCKSFSLHGKLTGAGGGGCVFVLLSPSVSEETVQMVSDTLSNMNYVCFRTSLGSKGVHIVSYSLF